MLKDAILATVAYYDVFDFPLTSFEAHRYLVNPKRLSRKTEAVGDILLAEVLNELDKLVESGKLFEKFGLYCLAERRELVEVRLEREKIAAQKWRRLRRRAFWLQLAPWVRGIFVSGSMALGNTTSESDFDMLVIMQAGRLYLGRLFLSALTSLMRSRRTRYQQVAPDKFCFNHFITIDRLTIDHHSLYNAQTYTHLVPLMIDKQLAASFFAANLWINKYVYNFAPRLETVHREIKISQILKFKARAVEWLFNNKFGNLLEKLARAYQQKRINENPATHTIGGRVIFTDTELEFHPQSFERTVLDHYNRLARQFKFSDLVEPDSGLTRNK